jgi:phospholysine phosphohistidine inorganic pyrophosphate phosphatase
VAALARLKAAGIPIILVTNESGRTRASLHGQLAGLGFVVPEEDIVTPALAMAAIIREKGLRPHLLVDPRVRSFFRLSLSDLQVLSDFGEVDTSSPDCVVLGDANDNFNYSSLNRLLLSWQAPPPQCLPRPELAARRAPLLPRKGEVLSGGRPARP